MSRRTASIGTGGGAGRRAASIGIVGATGQVGVAMRQILEERSFPADEVRFLPPPPITRFSPPQWCSTFSALHPRAPISRSVSPMLKS